RYIGLRLAGLARRHPFLDVGIANGDPRAGLFGRRVAEIGKLAGRAASRQCQGDRPDKKLSHRHAPTCDHMPPARSQIIYTTQPSIVSSSENLRKKPTGRCQNSVALEIRSKPRRFAAPQAARLKWSTRPANSPRPSVGPMDASTWFS